MKQPKVQLVLNLKISTDSAGKVRYTEDQINVLLAKNNVNIGQFTNGKLFLGDKTNGNKIIAEVEEFQTMNFKRS